MIQIELFTKYNLIQIRDFDIYISGFFQKKSQPIDYKDVAESLIRNLNSFLQEIDGDFYFVIHDKVKNSVKFGVDSTRKKSLFYKTNNSQIIITDNIQNNFTTDSKLSKTSLIEFEYSGYTLGNKTLFENIFQVNPGSFIEWSNENINHTKYYEPYLYQNEEFNVISREKLIEELDQSLNNSFEATLNYTKNKTIFLPLSGGLDSRLVLAMLKRFGAKDVVCYSYGVSGNSDSLVSQKMAKKAGYKWFFVKYSNKKWHNIFHSEFYQEYVKYASNFTSMPHMLEILALSEIREKHDVSNAIFMPGHTGDFISGGHLSYFLKNINEQIEYLDFIQRIIKKHFSLKLDYSSNNHLYQTIYNNRGLKIACENKDFVKTYEDFEYNNRQSKYIINSSRLFEYIGSESAHPFWRKDYVKFWSKVNLPSKFNKSLYIDYIKKKHPFFFSEKNNDRKKKAHYYLTLFQSLLSYVNKDLSTYFDYHTNSGAFYGAIGIKRFLKDRMKYRSIIGYTTAIYLEKLLNFHQIEN